MGQQRHKQVNWPQYHVAKSIERTPLATWTHQGTVCWAQKTEKERWVEVWSPGSFPEGMLSKYRVQQMKDRKSFQSRRWSLTGD